MSALTSKSKARHFYQFLGWAFQNENDWRFMNYGYAYDDPAANPSLQKQDEGERYSAQLYHRLADSAYLNGKRLLDIGTGRGGGASYLHRNFGTAKTIGVDLASTAVANCRNLNAGIDGLSYKTADALALPFEDGAFDIAVNVESAHCYPDFDKFLHEVTRVLAPGGQFLFTDFTGRNNLDEPEQWQTAFRNAGFTDVALTDITKNVAKGLQLDTARRRKQINAKFPFGTRKLAMLWAGLEGSRIYKDFATVKRRYVILRGRNQD